MNLVDPWTIDGSEMLFKHFPWHFSNFFWGLFPQLNISQYLGNAGDGDGDGTLQDLTDRGK